MSGSGFLAEKQEDPTVVYNFCSSCYRSILRAFFSFLQREENVECKNPLKVAKEKISYCFQTATVKLHLFMTV